MAYWLVKTEPNVYSYADLERAGRDVWDGVRYHAARGHLAAMNVGDEVFVYHTGNERAIIGVGRVVSPPYPDPTDSEGKWVAVDIEAVGALPRPISLQEIKQLPAFANWELVRLPRLSVMPVPEPVWHNILNLSVR